MMNIVALSSFIEDLALASELRQRARKAHVHIARAISLQTSSGRQASKDKFG